MWRFVCLCSASDNIPKADEIRTLVKDIWDTRVAKLRLSADSFISQLEAHAKVQLMAKNHTLSIKLPHIFKEYWMAETIGKTKLIPQLFQMATGGCVETMQAPRE